MIGLDTNVLVRYVMQDDPRQSAKANRVIDALTQENPGFLSLIVLVEFVWVLESCYDLDRGGVSRAMESILRSRELCVDRVDLVTQALRVFQSGKADFADCLIARICSASSCDQTLTFDADAATFAGMTLIA